MATQLVSPNTYGMYSYLVILKIRSKRTQRNTEMPRGDMILVSTRMVSRIPPQTTKLSKRLKSDTKYACGEERQVELSTEGANYYNDDNKGQNNTYLEAQAVHLQQHLTGEQC